MMGNKGAVKISFNLAETKLCFINAHLHSGQSEVKQRNKDINTILNKFLSMGGRNLNKIAPGEIQGVNKYDSIVFMGDLNYRINGIGSSIM
jgi:endonuclease/exonuclease/phosphatase family metal-dependent hydrolase